MKFAREWPVAWLGDVTTDIQAGFAQAPCGDGAGIGQIRTHNVSPDGELTLAELKYVSPSEKEFERYLLKKGDVVFNNTNSEEWVGKTALFDTDEVLLFSNHMTRIRVNDQCLSSEFLARYLHFLWHMGFSKSRAKRWVSQAAVDQRELVTFRVPLPPLPEQQRIVEILKQADALRRQRREALDQTKQLPTALFLEMFGDPKKWGDRKVRLADITTFVTSGSRDWSKYYSTSNDDSKFIRVHNLKAGAIDMSDMAYVKPPENSEAERARIQPGDLLISITGTVGQVAIAPLTLGDGYISQHVALVRTDGSLPGEFLVEFLNHPAGGQLQIQRANYGQTKPGLNLQQIRNFQIPQFDDEKVARALLVKREISSLKGNMESELTSINALHESLLQQAFSGNLTETWREVHRADLDVWLREHAESLRKRSARVSTKVIAPPELAQPERPTRRWLVGQLGDTQSAVYLALQEWKGALIPSEDLDSFLAEWPVDHLEGSHDQIRRALTQLAGLGLIAQVSLPNEAGEYVMGYRMLHEADLSKANDQRRLGAAI